MKRVFLHIGRHKCGTTSIQKTLYQNRSKLLESGFYYPETGVRVAAHHYIAEALRDNNPAQSNEIRKELSTALRNEIKRTNCRNVVISSEGLQSCNPAIVAEFFAGFDVVPICYLREQAAYLRSSYLQKVHATNYTGSIEHFYQQGFSTDYRVFLEKWKAVFDNEFHIRLFDRKSLVDGDAVRDFLIGVLGLTSDEMDNLEVLGDENPSLSREMLAFKLEYNSRDLPNNGEIYFGLGKLSKESGSKYEIPLAITQAVRAQYAESNKWVEENLLSDGQQFSYPTYEEEALGSISSDEFDVILKNIEASKRKELERIHRERKQARQLERQQARLKEKEERQEKRKLERQKQRQKQQEKEKRKGIQKEKQLQKQKEKQEKKQMQLESAPGFRHRVARAFHRFTR